MDTWTVLIFSIAAALVIFLVYCAEQARRTDVHWDDLDEGDGTHEVTFEDSAGKGNGDGNMG